MPGLISIVCLEAVSPMAKSETLNLRVSTDFKRRLTEEAKREKRSVTNYVEVILTEYWERRDSRAQHNVEKSLRK